MIRLHNTLTRELEPLQERDEGKIGMYVCGATVQSEPHLGHGRYAVAFDVIHRYLVYRGYDVTFVRNITDVEDKIIAAANDRGISVEDLVPEMIESFESAYRALGVLPPTIEPKATEHIPDMIEMVSGLIERGLAYPAGGDVYFSVRGLETYGALSRQKVDDLVSGARIDPGEEKQDPLDFALWKAAKPGEPSWDSPWGPGRPGWHIECSAMAVRYLGDGFDIHGGGRDLIFPHHENEIAQSEGLTGERFARYWLHNGMVNLGGEKMAKSTGNIIDLTQALATHHPMAVRLYYLRTHYRSPIEFSEELLADNEAAWQRLLAFHRRAGEHHTGEHHVEPEPVIIDRFVEAMDEDFGTPDAVGVLFDALREGNRLLDSGEDAGAVVAAFSVLLDVLGLEAGLDRVDDLGDDLAALAVTVGLEPASSAEETLAALLTARAGARAAREWARSDEIRDRLVEIGIVVEDTPDGIRWHRA